MAQASTSRKGIYIGVILILVIVVAALAYVLVNKGSNDSTSNLKITSFERDYIGQFPSGSDTIWSWNVICKIVNNGNNNIYGAQLVVQLQADHVTIGTASKTFDLQSGWSSSESVAITAKQSDWSGKTTQAICTVYQGNQVLDQYTTSW